MTDGVIHPMTETQTTEVLTAIRAARKEGREVVAVEFPRSLGLVRGPRSWDGVDLVYHSWYTDGFNLKLKGVGPFALDDRLVKFSAAALEDHYTPAEGQNAAPAGPAPNWCARSTRWGSTPPRTMSGPGGLTAARSRFVCGAMPRSAWPRTLRRVCRWLLLLAISKRPISKRRTVAPELISPGKSSV
jgi:hypothetical protein